MFGARGYALIAWYKYLCVLLGEPHLRTYLKMVIVRDKFVGSALRVWRVEIGGCAKWIWLSSGVREAAV